MLDTLTEPVGPETLDPESTEPADDAFDWLDFPIETLTDDQEQIDRWKDGNPWDTLGAFHEAQHCGLIQDEELEHAFQCYFDVHSEYLLPDYQEIDEIDGRARETGTVVDATEVPPVAEENQDGTLTITRTALDELHTRIRSLEGTVTLFDAIKSKAAEAIKLREEWEEQKALTKAAKDRLDDASKAIETLCQSDPNQKILNGMQDMYQPLKPAEEEPSAPVEDDVDASLEQVEDEAPQGPWQERPITKLDLPTVSMLGDAKIAAIIDQVPTLGDFEDLRVKAHDSKQIVANLLPKGVGPKSADEMEARLIRIIADANEKDTPAVSAEDDQDNETIDSEPKAEEPTVPAAEPEPTPPEPQQSAEPAATLEPTPTPDRIRLLANIDGLDDEEQGLQAGKELPIEKILDLNRVQVKTGTGITITLTNPDEIGQIEGQKPEFEYLTE